MSPILRFTIIVPRSEQGHSSVPRHNSRKELPARRVLMVLPVLLGHGAAHFQKGRNTQHCACPANGGFPNWSQLFVLAALASRGIALHGSIRTAVTYLTKTAGAKLCLQLSGAIKARHPPRAGCNRSCRTVAVRVLPHPAGCFSGT